MSRAKSSVEEKIIAFFRDADLNAAIAIFNVVRGVVKSRQANGSSQSATKPVVKKRTRRTKAQVEADRQTKAAESTTSAPF